MRRADGSVCASPRRAARLALCSRSRRRGPAAAVAPAARRRDRPRRRPSGRAVGRDGDRHVLQPPDRRRSGRASSDGARRNARTARRTRPRRPGRRSGITGPVDCAAVRGRRADQRRLPRRAGADAARRRRAVGRDASRASPRETVARLQQALAEAAEARAPGVLLRSRRRCAAGGARRWRCWRCGASPGRIARSAASSSTVAEQTVARSRDRRSRRRCAPRACSSSSARVVTTLSRSSSISS